YKDGSKKDLSRSVTWTLSAPSVATISSSGLATAIAAGTTTIRATSGSTSGSASMIVMLRTLVSIAVTPSNPSLAAGQQQQFTATGTFANGSHQNLTSTAAWTSSAPSIATISSSGLATALAAGSTTIQAVAGSINTSTSLAVTWGSIALDGSAHGVQDNGLAPGTTAIVSIGTPSAADLISCEVSLTSIGGNSIVSVADDQNGTYAAAVP